MLSVGRLPGPRVWLGEATTVQSDIGTGAANAFERHARKGLPKSTIRSGVDCCLGRACRRLQLLPRPPVKLTILPWPGKHSQERVLFQGEPPSHGASPFYRRLSAGRNDLNEVAGFHQKCKGQSSHRRMEGVPDEAPPNVSVSLSTVMHRNRPVAVTNEVPTHKHPRFPFGQRGRDRFPRLGNPSHQECVAMIVEIIMPRMLSPTVPTFLRNLLNPRGIDVGVVLNMDRTSLERRESSSVSQHGSAICSGVSQTY